MIFQKINFIKDPSLKYISGLNVLYQKNEFFGKSSEMLFWDDPDGIFNARPYVQNLIEIKRFEIEISDGWTLNGHRFFINKEVGFFTDALVNESGYKNMFSTDGDTSLKFDSLQENFLLKDDEKKINHLSGRVGIAVSVEPSNWGSFLTRIIPKAIRLFELKCEYLLCYCNHPNQLNILKLIGWKESQIIKFNPAFEYTFENGLLISELTNSLFMSPFALELVDRISSKYNNKPRKKIFISRQNGIAKTRNRVCLNAEDLENALLNLGFEIITPDLLSIEEQISIFSSAEVIVGPSGAGMFNSMFSLNKPLIIDIESQQNWLYGHAHFFSSLDVRWGFFIAKADSLSIANHKPFTVNINALKLRLLNSMY